MCGYVCDNSTMKLKLSPEMMDLVSRFIPEGEQFRFCNALWGIMKCQIPKEKKFANRI